MSAIIKSAEEIVKMREAGRLAAEVLEMIEPHVKAGVSTEELDAICHKYITETQQAIPAPLNYHGFPKSICTSINHVVCHGIPSTEEVLKDGDIVNIDVTVIKDGYHGDTSKMFLVGEVSAEDKALCHVAQESLYQALKKVKPGARVGDIGTEIQKFIKNRPRRYSIVKDYCGHGIGAEFHEEPQVVHYKNSDRTVMKAGMCFTIEPMINAGKFSTVLDDEDGWTVYTEDGKKSAQWEHTILVTDNGCEILTLRSDEKLPRILVNA
ncbi:type I methionyl aminopeptidase [Enterovibrio paralichthyis]|uniref:type I methionyl aminopeptidase n=1 Tax=Enterovibrio paralichthyis TaxID=2853805 RepID=UPI001C487F59|nr:type I methionyl aminopeptidase [Enterovibrio paralichthyis]MBV7300068.1 type I methionyl aminopeptidase [Enterovibrio paralichthyis]